MVWAWCYALKLLLISIVGVFCAVSLVLFGVYLRLQRFRRDKYIFARLKELPILRHLCFHATLLESSKFCANFDVHLMNYFWYELGCNKEKGFCSTFVGTIPTLVVFRADYVEQVLGNNRNLTKGPTYSFLTPWLGDGLLTSHGPKWKSRRKFLTPAFHFKILDKFAVIMNRQAEVFSNRIANKSPDEDILQYLEAFTLDVVCETIMGISMNCQLKRGGREYLGTIKNVSHLLVKRFGNPKNWIDFIYNRTKDGRELTRLMKQLQQFTINVINERKAELLAAPEALDAMTNSEEAMTQSKKPFLDLMLVEHLKTKSLTIEDIREQVDTFMFGGHDTTSLGLTWALYLIGLHQDVQEKLHEEINGVFRGNVTCDVTADHVKELKYLEMVLKECQRLYPSVTLVTRTVTEEFAIDGKLVPVGTELAVLIKRLHEDPDVFPKPDEFDPERFSAENSRNRHAYAYVPFSAGPRNCIGQRFAMLEEKILLVWVLRKFQIKSLDYRDKILVKTDLVLRPQSPIRIALRRRLGK